MSIRDFLYENAVKDVWVNPHGDRNVMFKANMISRHSGVVNTLILPYDEIEMPISGTRYTVYELGGVVPEKIGIDVPLPGWVSLDALSHQAQVYITIFSRGRMASLTGAYIQILPSKTVIIAIDYSINNRVLSLKDDMYVRFYSNIYYEHSGAINKRLTNGTYINQTDNVGAYLVFSNLINSIRVAIGVLPLIYLNGLYLPDGVPNFNKLVSGDRIDYIVDPLIMNVDAVRIEDMEAYTSILDQAFKMIVSLDSNYNNIYVDDMEFYITGVRTDGIRVGAYLPRLAPSSIRMLTYTDWAINSAQVTGRLDELKNMIDSSLILNSVKLYVLRRDNGETRDNLLDSSRIPDLMNLPTAIRKTLLAGINSNLPIWNASSLEDCAFNHWVSLEGDDNTGNSITGVYSRHAALSVLERVRKLHGNTDWSLPPSASDGGGILVMHNPDGSGIIPVIYSASNHTNETYANGKGYEVFYPGYHQGYPLDILVPAGTLTDTLIENGFGIFIYYDNDSTLVPAIYGTDYQLTEVGNQTQINWSNDLYQYDRYIRTSQKLVFFTLHAITLVDIIAGIDMYNGRTKLHDVGMSTLCVWYNDHYMVEGLDYHVLNGRIYLVSNNKWWTDTAKLDVIYAGLPDSSLKHVVKGNWGWIKYGQVTNNNVYDLYAYRNKLFYIDGVAVPFNEIQEAEHYINKITIGHSPYIDGTPYAIVDVVQFTRDEELNTIVRTAETERLIDEDISNILSLLDPQSPIRGTITINSKYDLVSPLMNKLIDDILLGVLVLDVITYSDSDLMDILMPYQQLLRIDPTQMNHDLDFVEIHPKWTSTVVDVTTAQYNFLNRVNEYALYGNVYGLNLYLNLI